VSAGPGNLLVGHAPSPSPRPALGERETRFPLGKQTCDGMGESRFRVTRRPQPAFLLPEGEGQDEGKGGIQQPSRDLLFENSLPRLYPLQTPRNLSRIPPTTKLWLRQIFSFALWPNDPASRAAANSWRGPRSGTGCTFGGWVRGSVRLRIRFLILPFRCVEVSRHSRSNRSTD